MCEGSGAEMIYSIMRMFSNFNYKLPCQEKLFIWPPFFQCNKRLLSQKTGGACLYMPQDGHWLDSFEVIPPPKKDSFSAAKK